MGLLLALSEISGRMGSPLRCLGLESDPAWWGTSRRFPGLFGFPDATRLDPPGLRVSRPGGLFFGPLDVRPYCAILRGMSDLISDEVLRDWLRHAEIGGPWRLGEGPTRDVLRQLLACREALRRVLACEIGGEIEGSIVVADWADEDGSARACLPENAVKEARDGGA